MKSHFQVPILYCNRANFNLFRSTSYEFGGVGNNLIVVIPMQASSTCYWVFSFIEKTNYGDIASYKMTKEWDILDMTVLTTATDWDYLYIVATGPSTDIELIVVS